jgi:hypothetical protein
MAEPVLEPDVTRLGCDTWRVTRVQFCRTDTAV